MIKPVLIVNYPEDPKLIYTLILEEGDIKRLIEQVEGNKHECALLDPIDLKYHKEYDEKGIGGSPRFEIRNVDYENLFRYITATPIVLENNIIRLVIRFPIPMFPVSLSIPSIQVEISIEDLKTKVLRDSVNSLKFDFGDGVFGEVCLKVPIEPKEPDPIKIVSSNLLVSVEDETAYFKHTCNPVYTDGWVVFSFEYSTPGKPIQFVSKPVDLYFINSKSRIYIYKTIKIAQELLKDNYGITTELSYKEGSGEFLLDIVESNHKFEVGSVHLICSDISKVVGKYLSSSYGDINLGVNTRYIYKMGKGKFLIEFIHKIR